MSSLKGCDLPQRWELIGIQEQYKFFDELKRELSSEHILFGVSAIAIARKEERDDILFFLKNCAYQYAEVHLTWHIETDCKWPSTILFKTFNEWKHSIESVTEE